MSKDKTNQKGITLIALVITIIVMLILVGVTISVALNGGLFTTAKEAAEGTASKKNEELELSSGKVEINGEWYNSIDEYVNGGQKVAITPKKETYTIEEEVKIGEESFYVIADDAEKVTLLAKYLLNKEGTAQINSHDSTGVGCVFSSTNYWDSETTEYPLNLNNYAIPEGVTTPAITAAKAYGEAKGGTGRLLTIEEYTSLLDLLSFASFRDIVITDNFWLGSAFNGDSIYMCDYVGGDESGGSREYDYLDDNYYDFGCRPVVEIEKSSIS